MLKRDNKNKEADAQIVASMVIQKVLAELENNNVILYINFSINNYIAEEAPVASMIMHQSNKLGPSGLPGSNPGWSASALSVNKLILSKTKK